MWTGARWPPSRDLCLAPHRLGGVCSLLSGPGGLHDASGYVAYGADEVVAREECDAAWVAHTVAVGLPRVEAEQFLGINCSLGRALEQGS